MTVHSLPSSPPSSDDAGTVTALAAMRSRARSPRTRTLIRLPWVRVIGAPDAPEGDRTLIVGVVDLLPGRERRAA